eukprot:TRINITY_DN7739_c0_g1_i8.p1 TRINITY_DN7739_c0_g1~~TRINITY_DN7739_c0_g1_i8.p1  ORF type:complete len:363 (-),score=58.11 TRINITY_DN7739_c0_g1_i8:168-1256(-)
MGGFDQPNQAVVSTQSTGGMLVLLILLCLLGLCCSSCVKIGTWTSQTGSTPLYDSYMLFDSPTGFDAVAASPSSWASGTAKCSGSLVQILLDGRISMNGKVSENGTRIDWNDNTVWKYLNIRKVHVVWMNHLDVGYNGIPVTGFINNVLNVYFHSHFPRALRLQKALRLLGSTDRFIYTTHPWLVSLYLDCPTLVLANVTLKCPSLEAVEEFTQAILRGDIVWHAGPFNLQPENMDPSLFEYGLSMAQDLDIRFNIQRKLGVLSQRDVPGMTRSVIPLLVKHNVLGITVGQNFGTPPVAVPKLFRWREPASQTEVIGIYHPFGYGDIHHRDDAIAPNGVALSYAFRQDNQGLVLCLQLPSVS